MAVQANRDNHPMLFQCQASVEDVGPTLKQYLANGTRLLGCSRYVYNTIMFTKYEADFLSIALKQPKPSLGVREFLFELN